MFGSQGLEPQSFPPVDRSVLDTNHDFWQVREHGRKALNETNHERFITDFYAVVLEHPRNYTNLLAELRMNAMRLGCRVAGDDSADELCTMIWDEAGKGIEISGMWYINYIRCFTQALRCCPVTDKIQYF